MKTRMSWKPKKGFSLIELMIVVAIIGVLSWVSIPKYQNYVLKATVSSQMLTALKPIQLAVQEYVALYGVLPTSFSKLADIGFVDVNGETYDDASDFSVSAVSGVSFDFPDDETSELVLGISFACDSLSTAACTKLAPEALQELTLEVSSLINLKNGSVYFTIDKNRTKNKSFVGFLPSI